jgi:glyoxylase-like metal-dependent hydrolase (beta-lactamase superfamily II)
MLNTWRAARLPTDRFKETDVKPYEIYAIRYATVARRAHENFIGGDPHETSATMDYFVWLVRNDEHQFVVDTGFGPDAARRRKRDFLRPPTEGLAMLGVDATQVKEVILTHMHYDHVGNFDKFPNARFHLQDQEMSFATGRYMCCGPFSHAYEVEEVVGMVRRVYAGRVEFHDGDAEIAPGVSLHHIGGHTMGLQAVRVWTSLGWMVLASDASHYYANMLEGRPFPIVIDVAKMVDGWKKLNKLASAPQYVIPGHDPLVMQRYRAPDPSMQGIIVRLDAEPAL